ncbi:Oligosaccharide translocation protein rft1, partial [Massospora cicadina]
ASYLISLQLFSRILTFMLNQFVVKLVGSKVYGAAMVDFELLLSTILFLSREGFRCALLRANVDESSKMSSHITLRQSNLAYLPIPIGLLISSILVLYHLMGNKLQSEVPCYYASAALYVAAAMVELLSEPLYILNLSQLNYPLRFKIEASAVFLKCVCTFIISFGLFHFIGEASSEYAILSFGVSQLVYSFVLLAGYTKHFSSRSGLSLFPIQSFVKHLLTEGDKLLLAFLNSTGVEKGSLVARILFQPIEESGRGLFSKLLTDSCLDCLDFLTTIIKFHILLGFVFIFMVPHYTSTLFDLLLGPAWSKTNAPLILSVYCFYVPIMGINGITEAFVQAVAQPEELQALSYALSLFTAIFLAVGFCLVKILPSVAYAVILANSSFIVASVICGYSEFVFGFETFVGKAKH